MISLFKRTATLVKYPEPMKPEDVAKVFAEQGEGSRIWQALDSVIDQHLLSAVTDVSDPKLSSEERSHASGRVDAISTLKSKLEEFKSWRNGKMNFKTN